jgi:hypothetical protein
MTLITRLFIVIDQQNLRNKIYVTTINIINLVLSILKQKKNTINWKRYTLNTYKIPQYTLNTYKIPQHYKVHFTLIFHILYDILSLTKLQTKFVCFYMFYYKI